MGGGANPGLVAAVPPTGACGALVVEVGLPPIIAGAAGAFAGRLTGAAGGFAGGLTDAGALGACGRGASGWYEGAA